MTLKEWRTKTGRSAAMLAAEVGCSRQSIARYEAGHVPETDIVRKLHKISAGDVCPNDLYGLEPPAIEPELPLMLDRAA